MYACHKPQGIFACENINSKYDGTAWASDSLGMIRTTLDAMASMQLSRMALLLDLRKFRKKKYTRRPEDERGEINIASSLGMHIIFTA